MITLLLHYGSIKNKIALCTTDYGEWEGLGFPFLNLKISPCQASAVGLLHQFLIPGANN